MTEAKQTTKNQTKLSLSVVDNIEPTPALVEVTDRRRDYVYYGEDNLFPQYILDLYYKSSVMGSIVRGMVDYVCGNGIITADAIKDFSKNVNADYETLEDVVIKAVFDLILFDGFAIQVFRDTKGEISEMYNLDFANCRLSGDKKSVYYSNEWSRFNAKTTKIPVFDRTKQQRNSIFYFRGQLTPQSKTYPIPQYIGALADIRTSTEISNFHLNSILNNFNASCIINLNCGDVDEETKKRVENKFNEKFSGSDNAGKLLLNFNDNKETEMSVVRLQSDDQDKRYEQLARDVVKSIFVAFRATPNLFGLATDTTGFNSQEYAEAFKLYNRTVIKPYQLAIQRAFNVLFGLSNSIIIKPFEMVTENANKETVE